MIQCSSIWTPKLAFIQTYSRINVFIIILSMTSDMIHVTSFNKIKYLTPFSFSHLCIHMLISIWYYLHLSVSKTIMQRNLYLLCSLQSVISASVLFTESQFCRFTYDLVGNANMGQATKLKRSATPCHSPSIHPSPFPTNTWRKTRPKKSGFILCLKGWLISGLAHQRPGQEQALSFSCQLPQHSNGIA